MLLQNIVNFSGSHLQHAFLNMLNKATKTNAENLRQYKHIFSLILEQILASSTNLVSEVKNLSPNFKRIR